MEIKKTLEGFAQYLEKKGMSYEIVVAGGAALILLDFTNRLTHDVDVVSPSTAPPELLLAALDYAEQRSLEPTWFNTAASIFTKSLRPKWESRATTILDEPGLKVRVLAREDLLRMKLFALCDRSRDLHDCVRLRPTNAELREHEAWLRALKPESDWTKKVDLNLGRLKKELQKQHEPDFE